MKLTFTKLKDIISLHGGRNLTYIELYKKFFMYVMDRQQELDKKESTKWMSNISSPVLYMLTMAVFGMYQDSKVAFEVYTKVKVAKSEWLTEEEQKVYDKLIVDTNNTSNNLIDLFESIYEECDGSDEFDMSVLDAIILGNGFWGIGYEKSEDEYEVIDPKTGGKQKITEKINIPSVYRIVPLNFFTEVSARSQKRAKVNIIRKVLTKDTINNMYKIYWAQFNWQWKETIDIIEKKDWNMVLRFMIFNNMPFVTTMSSLNMSDSWVKTEIWDNKPMHTDIRTDNTYQIGQDIHEVYEVHTDKTIQIFVDWKDLWIFARLWPWKEKPIYKLAFRDGINGLYDMWIGTIGYNFHKVVNWFLNLRVDNDRLAASAPLVVNSDDPFFDGMDYLEQHPWKLIKVKDMAQKPQSIEYNTNQWGVANSEVEMLWTTVQEAVWVSWYKMWIQQKVERAAKWVEELVESADASMKSFINSIAAAKWFIAKYVTLLALYYMDDESIFNMCGNKNLKEEINISDFVKDYTFDFNIQSTSSLRERQELDIIKWIVRDYADATRPNWTPLLNKENAFRLILEKSWAPEDLLLTNEDSMEYMEQQIQDNAKLKKDEMAALPPQPVVPWQWWDDADMWIVPPVWVDPQAMWAAPAPWVQGWSLWAWMAAQTNPLWNNWQI